MMKHKKANKKTAFGLVAVILLTAILAVSAIAAPGSDEDPLISLSYINEVLMPEIKAYIDEKIATITGGDSNNTFELVNMTAGQQLIGDKGCEIILRQGTGTIIATQKGGIADSTQGIDLANGTAVPSNHLLIIPFDDGRGINMTTNGILMVKGTYSLKQEN